MPAADSIIAAIERKKEFMASIASPGCDERRILLHQRAIFMLNCDEGMQNFDRSWRVADEARRVSHVAGERTRSLRRRDAAELVSHNLLRL
jgi:hypothetical protein